MAKYHINPRTGGVSACGAKIKCPFGDLEKEHYPTREGAEQAYEARMRGETLPPPVEKLENHEEVPSPPAKRVNPAGNAPGQRELNSLAKSSQEEEVLAYAAEQGSEQVLRALTGNEAATARVLTRVVERSLNNETRKKAEEHPNFVPERWDDESIKRAAMSPRTVGKLFPLIHQGNDATANYLLDLTPSQDLRGEIVFTRNPKVWFQTQVRAFKEAPRLVLTEERVQTEGKRILNFYHYATEVQRLAMAKYQEDPQGISLQVDYLVARQNNEGGQEADLREGMTLYRNPHTPREAREVLEESHPRLASYGRVVRAQEAEGGSLMSTLVESHSTPGASATGRETYKFKREGLETLNLVPEDVDTLVRHHWGNYLFGASYDEETGVYSGYRD